MKNILINFILFILAITLFAVFLIPGFLFATYSIAWQKGFKGLHDYFSGLFGTIAIDVDRSGNFVLGPMLNYLFIRRNLSHLYGEYVIKPEDWDFYHEYVVDHRFGDIRETISSVLGKNQRAENLTTMGRWMCGVLDRLDYNHCQKWIAYYKKTN